MRCIVCNQNTAFCRSGWFGQILPFCTKHYNCGVGYGGGLTLQLFKGGENVEILHPENIMKREKYGNKK
jgi:hypothetical protein